MSKITLIGMYNFLNSSGDDLFLNMALPTGIDKDAVIDNILTRGGEFEVLYSSPYFVKNNMMIWSKKWHWTFDRWLKAINIEYSPLENYDRIETYSETGSLNSSRQDSITDNLTQTTNASDSGTTETQKSAFDSGSYSPYEKNITDMENDSTIRNTGTHSQTGSSDSNSTVEHNMRVHGNIGVTTSQQMLQSEIDIAMFNLYDRIADVFLQEYIIPIY